MQLLSTLSNYLSNNAIFCSKKYSPKGNRTPVAELKTRCPRPLDDGASSGKPEIINP